ncbi:MAG: alpha/beta hydrolase [Chloroflexi bacterium]|nr:alpha/beta hydrolase [Chloroflexota bacterium]
MKYSENSKEIRDGKTIFFQSWLPDKKLAGMIILIHGLGEHSGRYGTHFADFYTSHNIGIKAFDLPGHGRSYGKKGHIDDPILTFEIIDDLINESRIQFPDTPLFIYGHSFGGEIGLWYNLARNPKTNGVIITSPLIGPKDPVPAAKMFLAKTMDKLYPTFSMENGLRPEDLARDEKIVKDYNSDPLVHPMITAKTGMVIINRGMWIMENASKNSNETLIMFGDCENIVNPRAIIEYSQIAPSVTLKIWPDCFHEIHNEPEKETIFNFTLNWIKDKS